MYAATDNTPPAFDYYEAAVHRLVSDNSIPPVLSPSRLPQHPHLQQTTLNFNGVREGSPRLALDDSHYLHAPSHTFDHAYTTSITQATETPLHPALRRLSLVTASSTHSPDRNSNPLTTFDQFLPATTLTTGEGRPQRPSSLGIARDSFKRLLRQSTDLAPLHAQAEMEKQRDENGIISPIPRLSDESNGNPARMRKKSGFAKLVNSMLGSPRPTISAPMNPVHITRVGYDHETGQFTVCSASYLIENLKHVALRGRTPYLTILTGSTRGMAAPLGSAGHNTDNAATTSTRSAWHRAVHARQKRWEGRRHNIPQVRSCPIT